MLRSTFATASTTLYPKASNINVKYPKSEIVLGFALLICTTFSVTNMKGRFFTT